MQYSVQSRHRIFVKDYLSFTKHMGKIQVKPWIVNIAKRLLIELSNVPQMCLKLLQKEQFKETVGAPCDLNVCK